MPRTADKRRPEELLEAILRCVSKKGLRALSLRPLAKDVGSSPRVLLYYFGSKERLTAKVFERIRIRQQTWIDAVSGSSLHAACTRVWEQMILHDELPWFQLFFEAYAYALAQPKKHREFLRHVSADWIGKIAKLLEQTGCARRIAPIAATTILAGFRGFMLDYCATRDRPRIRKALELWGRGLESQLERPRRTMH